MAEKGKKRNNRNNNYDDDFNPKFRKQRKKVCALCADKDFVLDYKNADQLRKFINDKGKILPRWATGACAKHQRCITLAVNRRFTTQGQERQADFLPIVVWGKTAEFCS